MVMEEAFDGILLRYFTQFSTPRLRKIEDQTYKFIVSCQEHGVTIFRIICYPITKENFESFYLIFSNLLNVLTDTYMNFPIDEIDTAVSSPIFEETVRNFLGKYTDQIEKNKLIIEITKTLEQVM